jgi:RNA polymerase sigma-70 factor (ECF subfamily)
MGSLRSAVLTEHELAPARGPTERAPSRPTLTVLRSPRSAAAGAEARESHHESPVTSPQPVHPDVSAAHAALIARAKRGDALAFGELVNVYYQRCLRFALNMLGNREDAEEVVQDTFVRVHRALDRYDESQRFEPWLFRILANRCRTMRARERRHSRFLSYGDAPDHHASTPNPENGSLWRDELHRAIALLPKEQREAFLLRHVEGLGYEDISAATGDGVSALKMRVKRACDFLRARLQEVER